MNSNNNEYTKLLCKHIGLNPEDYGKLAAIVSQEEFEELSSKFCEMDFKPGELQDNDFVDSYDFCYLNACDFRANLHVHSNNSDGMMSVERILNNAAKVADKLFDKTGSKFFMALTDHDTLDGAKELLLLVASNSEKYKNLKISLGIEISTIGTSFKNQLKPISIHTLVYCINPFDEKFNDFISEKARLKLELAHQTIARLNSELNPELAELGIKFDINEAAQVHEMILKGQDSVYAPLLKYTSSKILFTYLLNKLGLASENLRLEKPLRKYKKLFKGNIDFCTAYKTGLGSYVSDVYKKDFEMPEIPETIKALIARARKICREAHPTMDLIPSAFASFEKTVEFISKQDYGVMSIAHPARIVSENVSSEVDVFYKELFEKFKKAGGNRAKYFEKFYCSYEGEKMFEKLDYINKAGDACGLLCTGGLDSHGPNVITRCPYF